MGTFTSDILDELSYCFTQELHTKVELFYFHRDIAVSAL